MLESDEDRAMKRLAEAPGGAGAPDARPGSSGQHVRSVLVASLVAAILAMIAIAAISTH